jgi:hypothetical protein
MKIVRLFALIAGLALLASCTAPAAAPIAAQPKEKTVTIPAVSYFEIPVTDMDRAMGFYSSVFGVDFTRETVDGYDMAQFPPVDGAASGALAKGDVYVPTRNGVILYFTVTNIDETVARATAKGAAILYAKKDNGLALVAEIEDSEGNRIALMQPKA